MAELELKLGLQTKHWVLPIASGWAKMIIAMGPFSWQTR